MRTTLYIVGWLFTTLALLCFGTLFDGTNKDWLFGLFAGVGFLFGSAVILTAAVRNYKGGFLFLTGILMLMVSIALIWSTYNYYQKAQMEFFKVGLIITSACMILGLILVWFGHKRHKKIQALLAIRTAEADLAAANKTDNAAPTSEGDSVGNLPGQSSSPLYPPMTLWRTYLLLIFSGALYSIFLAYRTLKDLHNMGEKHPHPKRDAIGIIIPFYGLLVFISMANSIAKLAKSNNISFKITPILLTGLLVLAGLASVFMPTFLYPLTLSISAIPWLLLHNQINCLRLTQSADWRQPVNSYTWMQRSVLIVGIPLTALLFFFSTKTAFHYYAADRLALGQPVSGQPQIYQLKIPDTDWRIMPPGTLDKDTDLELVNNPTNEWVVVRIRANQRQTLDNFVDQRREIVASSWKDFKVVEIRTLDSGAYLTPLSFAHYKENKNIVNLSQSLFIATVVTPAQVIEVIGQGSKNAGSTALQLVKSFQLNTKEGKQ